MKDEVTKKEYYEALTKLPLLRKKLFEARYKQAITRSLSRKKEVGLIIKEIKKEISKCLFLKKSYEESRGIKDEKHKTR